MPRPPDLAPAVTDGGTALDLARRYRERHRRLQDEMARQGAGALLLVGSAAVAYATGAWVPDADGGLADALRPAAVVAGGADHPHLFTPYPEGAPEGLPADHVHPPFALDDPAGMGDLVTRAAEVLGGRVARLGVDEMTGAMFGSLVNEARGGPLGPSVEFVEAGGIVGAARLCKTADEVECIRRAQRINELAAAEVETALWPGVRQSELTGLFLRRALELGADGWALDPIWQVMGDANAPAAATTHGGLAFPLTSGDRILRDGDVVWADTGLSYRGYVSDFGRTWPVALDPRPTDEQRRAFERWRRIVEAALGAVAPGARGADVVAAAEAANGGARSWPPHFYLAHGVGLASAEPPLIGTDLGPGADDALVLAPGMVLVFEPETSGEGHPGYRAEEVAVVTDDGYRLLTAHHWWPYG